MTNIPHSCSDEWSGGTRATDNDIVAAVNGSYEFSVDERRAAHDWLATSHGESRWRDSDPRARRPPPRLVILTGDFVRVVGACVLAERYAAGVPVAVVDNFLFGQRLSADEFVAGARTAPIGSMFFVSRVSPLSGRRLRRPRPAEIVHRCAERAPQDGLLRHSGLPRLSGPSPAFRPFPGVPTLPHTGVVDRQLLAMGDEIWRSRREAIGADPLRSGLRVQRVRVTPWLRALLRKIPDDTVPVTNHPAEQRDAHEYAAEELTVPHWERLADVRIPRGWLRRCWPLAPQH